MRDDLTLVEDIVSAAAKIARFVEGKTREQFLADEMAQSAVVREITVVGEAANRITTDFKALHPDIPWSRLAQVRHFYIHAYFRLDYNEVWTAATRRIPRLARQVAVLLPPNPHAQLP